MTYSSEVLADSPSVYYRCNETSGTTASDSSGNARHATITGPVALGQSALGPGLSTSFRFDGTSGNYVRWNPGSGTGIPNSTSGTVELVVKPNSLRSGATSNGLFQLGSVVDGDVMLRTSDSGLRAGQLQGYVNGTVAGPSSSSYDLATGVSYHVALAWSGTTATLYLNASAIYTFTISSATIADLWLTFPWDYTDGRQVDGWMSDVAVYPTALSQSRLMAHYAAMTNSLFVTVPAATGTTAMLPPTVGLTAGDMTVVVPRATATTAMLAPQVRLTSFLPAYDLDANNSQALKIPIQLTAVLEADVKVASPPSRFTEPQVRASRLSLVMPTPTLDSDGRPT